MVHRKRKGKRGELECRNALNEILGLELRRGQQFSGLGGDDVTGWDGVHIEVKRTELFNVHQALNQSTDDAKKDEVPIVCSKRNRDKWKVHLWMHDLVPFAKAVLRAVEANH